MNKKTIITSLLALVIRLRNEGAIARCLDKTDTEDRRLRYQLDEWQGRLVGCVPYVCRW